jgi:Tfp pilus assembly protein PilE
MSCKLDTDMKKMYGYSLIEFMVAMVVALILGVVVLTLFANLTRQSNTHKDVADIDKSLRTSMFIMGKDIANAGYLLSCTTGKACSGLLVAAPSSTVPITTPNTGGLIANYATTVATDPTSVGYTVAANAATGISNLIRTETVAGVATAQPIAANVIGMAWQFGSDAASTGTAIYSAAGVMISEPATAPATPAVPAGLRSVRIALLARSALPDTKYISPAAINWLGGTYNVPTANINYRYKVLQQEIYLANPQWTTP